MTRPPKHSAGAKPKLQPDHGFGIAGGFEKGGYVANCAEVAVDRSTGKVKVVRVVTAFECGAIVNPDGLKNQVEGAVIQGIGGALFEAIEFEDGKILNPRFSRYRVPRFSDVPMLETVLVDRKDLPSAGAGEAPIVGARAGHRQRHLRCHGQSAQVAADDAQRPESLINLLGVSSSLCGSAVLVLQC